MVIKYLKLPFLFDALQLQNAVNDLVSAKWQMHYQTLHYDGEWSAIPLRSVDGKTDSIMVSPISDVVYSDTAFLQNSPYLKTVLQTFLCPLQAVRLLKLNAGSRIKEHRDAELNFEKGEIRLHIPIVTHPDVAFYLDSERMYLKEGECWYMNFNLPHHIANNSPIDSVHLVIDATVNDWVVQLFFRSDIVIKKEIEDSCIQYPPEVKKLMIEQLRAMNTSVSNQLADELESSLQDQV